MIVLYSSWNTRTIKRWLQISLVFYAGFCRLDFLSLLQTPRAYTTQFHGAHPPQYCTWLVELYRLLHMWHALTFWLRVDALSYYREILQTKMWADTKQVRKMQTIQWWIRTSGRSFQYSACSNAATHIRAHTHAQAGTQNIKAFSILWKVNENNSELKIVIC
jgi:hypothetical protein